VRDGNTCRRAAFECLEAAHATTNQDLRTQLFVLAGKFLELANFGGSESALRALIDEFNEHQMRCRLLSSGA
jgi:hypothetical protein